MTGEYLKIATYLSPSIDYELHQVYQELFENQLSMRSILIVESRWNDGPNPNYTDPLSQEIIDIAFMSTRSFLKLRENKANVELLPVAPIYTHPKNVENLPIYYSDLIVHKSLKKKYEKITDLCGCKFAFSNINSISGYILPIFELMKNGYNSTFFSSMIHSGNHLESIKMVREQRVECAAVDSNALKCYLLAYPHAYDDFTVVSSLGPLPIQPIVIRSSLPDVIKKKLITILATLHIKSPSEMEKFSKFGILKFTELTDVDNLEHRFKNETDMYQAFSKQPKTNVYY